MRIRANTYLHTFCLFFCCGCETKQSRKEQRDWNRAIALSRRWIVSDGRDIVPWNLSRLQQRRKYYMRISQSIKLQMQGGNR